MFDKAKEFINKLGLTGEEYDDEDGFAEDSTDDIPDSYNDDYAAEASKVTNKKQTYFNEQPEESKVSRFSKKSNNKVTPVNSISERKRVELKVMRPRVYDDSREIADNLAEGKPIVLNLEGINADLAQRILDFASGAVYAQDGNLQRITSYIFVITPSNVDISGNFDEILSGNIEISGSSKYVFRD